MTSWLALLYVALVALVSLHGAHRAALLWAWARARLTPGAGRWEELPVVTVQLPVFNERDVVERLVRAAAALDWPAERLEIQLLDDSTDDTAVRAEPALAAARARGIDARVIRRPTREGYKAGALAWGLARARGELVAIFDADFVPPPDFLRRLVPELADPRVGMVQARWGHLDAGGALRGAQAALLDGHFVIEHAARHGSGAWFNFNGTAGVWRRACIEAAGGWQADTLTEDLDLSYRAQLAGWRFVYRPDVVVPAELPDSLAALRTQQRRWAKGSIETLRKLARHIVAARAPLRVRTEALAHLGANLGWPLSLALAVLLPVLVLTRGGAGSGHAWLDLPAFGFSMGVNLLFYRLAGTPWSRLPAVILLGVGLGVSQTLATLEGLRGRRSAFARTPKNGGGVGSYAAEHGGVAIELALGLLNLGVAGVAVARDQPGSVPFLLLFGLGHAGVATLALRERAAGAAPDPLALEPAPGK